MFVYKFITKQTQDLECGVHEQVITKEGMHNSSGLLSYLIWLCMQCFGHSALRHCPVQLAFSGRCCLTKFILQYVGCWTSLIK